MSAQVRQALPALVGALALGNAAQAWPLAVAIALCVVALAVLGPRLELDTGRQLLTGVIGAGVGYVSASLLHEQQPGSLSEGWARLAASAFMAGAARSLLLGARGGYLPSLALTFVGMVASGRAPGKSYGAFVVAFLLASLWALEQRPPRLLPSVSRRRAWLGAFILLLAAGFGVGSTLGLRSVHAWASQRSRWSAYTWRPQGGFSDRMDLGALDGLLDSSRRVLRVRGPRVDYLRGAVLDRYDVGRWMKSEAAEQEATLTFGGALPEQGSVEITAIAERTSRFFVPLEAQRLVTSPATVLVDDLGSIERSGRQGTASARFVPGVRQRARLAPPRAHDVQIPRRLRSRVEALATRWTEGATTDLEKLRAIERRLRVDYQYARAFTRPSAGDPLVDFLFRNRRGHCEYFASALALVARGAGVPTRIVMGYRVAERSPFGYYVVRERNAHAWVEAWLPGEGWSTRDATPEEALPQNREHDAGYGESSLDALSVGYASITNWLGRLSLLETSLAWVVGSLLLAGIVARGARRRARPAAQPEQAALPFLVPLLTELARTGHARRSDETLERLAARVPDPAPAGLIGRYAAFRYGGQGDGDALARDVAACTAASRKATRRWRGRRFAKR